MPWRGAATHLTREILVCDESVLRVHYGSMNHKSVVFVCRLIRVCLCNSLSKGSLIIMVLLVLSRCVFLLWAVFCVRMLLRSGAIIYGLRHLAGMWKLNMRDEWFRFFASYSMLWDIGIKWESCSSWSWFTDLHVCMKSVTELKGMGMCTSNIYIVAKTRDVEVVLFSLFSADSAVKVFLLNDSDVHCLHYFRRARRASPCNIFLRCWERRYASPVFGISMVSM